MEGKVASDAMGDWVDKGLEGASEGVNLRPRMIVNGLNQVMERAVIDHSW